MSLTSAQPALLVLADGTAYTGWSFGAPGTVIGEVVFNTGMTGYQEVLTDPSYCGQIVTFTYPELGNTGVNPEDEESTHPHVRGAIARNISSRPSNWRSTQSLPDYLKQHHIPGIYGIDTRALTRKIRTVGAMNGAISTEILDPGELRTLVEQAPSMAGLNLVKEVTTKQPYEWLEPTETAWEFSNSATGDQEPRYTVVALDFGVKRNILRRLASYGCRVIVVPANTSPEEILKYNPDGIFLSNGPGDPSAVTEGIAITKELVKAEKPVFGICMGHQILGLSLGAETFKLKFGHRGLNQPAGLAQQQVEITSQNHGFAIDPDTLASDVQITHLNLNDRTVAGLKHKTLPLFSVQYHPEASPGPHDADYLFERFVQAMQQQQEQN
ncbi:MULTISPECIES: glutamine-hydrolyzing carbamoyl-phosphate synthase small subunit [Planktothrix]|jgi:carbamoyl-phosphate synthase small subunit|uniref:Carbamoyl phosphate synthase small chain n=2 Tax=Planktothrix agardhii TaxID=1160 RepID=A0A073CWG3_PLAA1|nr:MULTISPECIES: glutamine-hydrolyzing carbamoyl-phosphate synthase small subunit [Planktothrix]BBD55829.1 carbamoyl-phosphate synthase small subunit [Planktothrix agardhii NIES-204]KEI68305.1 carbamoyl-phosphate synthase small subunit protein [Planktothrix agardhii NIVA-CYA 126/8]MBG0745219.1 glutamine-hydrolyzing carbamoyl-phosphate synthase small subunit [Planktothrix agardhii KL2]MCB8750095.1 glutamine-hydrolyzing carbamoyl-phosphate synthase small subunit [Planktothrix agardhii 1810]MCB87